MTNTTVGAGSPLEAEGVRRVHAVSRSRGFLAPVAAATSGVLVAAVALSAIADDVAPPNTYGATSTALLVIGSVAGAAAITAGVAAIALRYPLTGLLTVLIGVAWFANDWVGWRDGPPAARSLATVAVAFTAVFALHLVVTLTPGRPRTRTARWLVACAYGITAAVVVVRTAVHDPFLDPDCWANCTDNALLIRADPELAHDLERAAAVVAAVLAVSAAAAVGSRLSSATRVERRSTWFVLVPGALVAISFAVHVALVVTVSPEDPRRGLFATSFLARASAIGLLAAGVAWATWRRSRAATTIRDLAVDLGRTPSASLQARLAASFNDADLTVAYWLSSPRRFIDADGQPVEIRAAQGRRSSSITSDGELVAVIVHDATLDSSDELVQRFGPAALVAVDNERMQAGIRAQVAELRASRMRIVETADSTRRALERNLHDGAQQRLFAVAFELRMAASAAASAGLHEVGAEIAELGCDVATTTSDVRDLAHGIHPAILSEAGLALALRRLIERVSIPVVLDDSTVRRFAAAVESTAYHATTISLDSAVHAGATQASISLTEADGHLVVVVTHDGSHGSADVDDARGGALIVHLSDRVGALGGEIRVAAGEGSRIESRIPCAS